MYFYSNGDSFVFGMECMGDNNIDDENKLFSFPYQLQKLMGIHETYINNSYNGATNEFIFRNTIFDLLELESKGVKPEEVFVLVGWTSIFRTEVDAEHWVLQLDARLRDNIIPKVLAEEYADYGTFFINPTSNKMVENKEKKKKHDTADDILPFCVNYLWKESLQLDQQKARVLALHEFLKSKKYNHIFVNTCYTYKDASFKSIPQYFKPERSFYEWALDNYKEEIRAYNHFSPIPHREYAKDLFKFIKDNNFLD